MLKSTCDFEGEMTEEKFVELALEFEAANAEPFEDHPEAIMVDISGRDVTHFDNVDKALGVTRSNELSYESICAKVKPIDEARDKIVMESGFLEAYGKLVARATGDNSLAIEEEGEDEKKVEVMKIVVLRLFSASSSCVTSQCLALKELVLRRCKCAVRA